MATGAEEPAEAGGSFLTEAIDDHVSPVFAAGTVERARDAEPPVMEETVQSSRRKGLIVEAEMRAEQQALARLTMLDLARELEEAAKRRREIEMKLLQERREKEELLAARALMEMALKQAELAKEDAEVALARDRLMGSAYKGCFLPAALLWSRIAAPVHHMASELSPEDLQTLSRESASDENAAVKLSLVGKRSKGDGLMLMWIVRAWKSGVADLRREREQAALDEARRKAHLAELEKLREGHARELAVERSKIRGLEQQIQVLLNEIDALRRRIDQLEREKAELLKQIKPPEDHSAEIQELQRRILELESIVQQRDAAILELRENIRDLESSLVQQREEFTAEKSKLKAELRDISAELQRQIIFAKHLRDIALKAKRDAAGSISPEKFAQLISELEDMRDKLTALGSEHDREKDQSNLLRMKLEQNRRRLELERQFLPLLHKVKGPVGPKNPLFQKNMAAAAAAALVPDELGPGGLLGTPPDRLPFTSGDPGVLQGAVRLPRTGLARSMGNLEPMGGGRPLGR